MAKFDEPFGVAVAPDGTIFLTDGAANRLWRISVNGDAGIVTENLNTPSSVALAPDGTLVVADTGSHTIKRIDPRDSSNNITVIAGRENTYGFADGSGGDARFNAPVGVAVGNDNRIFVADTYNDRIRVIDEHGQVTTLAGSDQGYADAADRRDAQFNTPCGIALAPDSSLVVADTGNNRLRRIEINGRTTTIAGTGEATVRDGAPLDSAFAAPLGVVVKADGTIYTTDLHGSALRSFHSGEASSVNTLVSGEAKPNSVDGKLESARVNRPAGIALTSDGSIVLADAGNRLLRIVVRERDERGRVLSSENLPLREASAEGMRRAGEPRWPFEPPRETREIAATFGEVRGEVKDNDQVWFHNGLDIPGRYGETVRLVRGEKMLNPLSIEGVGTARERVRFPSIGYVHLRVGRAADEKEFNDARFLVGRDERGKVTSVRVRRGTQFAAGDSVGTLNNQNHMHLIAGPQGHEFNALAALELPGAHDTIPPTFDGQSVSFTRSDGQEFGEKEQNSNDEKKRTNLADDVTNTVYGDVRIIVRAFDSMEGSAARRKLGVYKLGYQVLLPDQSHAPGFLEPRMNISFESLPREPSSVRIAYAEGSRAGYTPDTVFAYVVTNIVRDKEATEDFWHTSELTPGDYIVRVFAEDFFGNRRTHDAPVRVVENNTNGV
ncbi:MAG: hypothetical protein WKF74_01855 [Pyrinomonadaceae bacterium]